MKKIIAIILAVFIVATCLCSCATNTDDGKKEIVTTIYPVYDWVRNIIGEDNENVKVTLLNETGVDLHSYQASAKDMVTISNCDMFIYIGGESESWIEDALKSSKNENRIAISLLDVLGDKAKEEEVKEGMQQHEEEEEEDEDEIEYDEHVWLSLKNAKIFANELKDQISKLDSDNKAKYEQNASKYIEQLNSIDANYAETLSGYKDKCVIVCDRMPFRYLFDDYDIDYYAAFVGCSAETEASFETIKFLADKLKESETKAVLKIEGSSDKIAKTVIDTSKKTDVKILTLNSIQNISKKDLKDGVQYIDIMIDNLYILKQVF